MKLSFHGAAQTVTGSKHLLELSNGKKVLLDCGLYQGSGIKAEENNRNFGFDPRDIDVMILSHAHIDHSGLIPKLFKEGFKGKVFCSNATKSLCEVMLMDSAKIQEDDIKFINKKRKAIHKPMVEPLYTLEDAAFCLNFFEVRELNNYFNVLEGVECMFTEIGHILGSVAINLKIKDKGKTTKLTFTGDVGRYNDPILKSPENFPQAEYIICESTYGDSIHEDINFSDEQLLKIITHTCVEKKGKLIIPSFSLGRTQEIVYALNRLEINKKLPNIKFYVDSPLSTKTTEITKKHKECYNNSILKYMKLDKDPFGFKNLFYITDVEDSKALNTQNEPCVILSASGMAEAGRIKHHILNNIENKRNTILIVGYCEPNSLGYILQTDISEVKIFGNLYKKKAEICKIRSFSAHADYVDLIQYLSCQDEKKVKKLFLVHGEYQVQSNFKNKLIKKGFDFVEIPSLKESFFL